MTAKHQTAEYRRNARIIRARVKIQHARGEAYPCWRCRGPIYPGQPYDAGHLPGAQGSSLAELAAEHRHKTTHCIGNRSHGAAQSRVRRSTRVVTSWPL